MKGARRKWAEIAFVVVLTVLGIFLSEKASAASVGDIMKKWVFTDYYDCLKYISPNITNSGGEDKTITIYWSDSIKHHLPSGGFGGNTNEDITCDQLFKGTGGLKSSGVLGYAGLSANQSWKNDEQAKTYLEKLGYEPPSSSGENYRFQIRALNEYTQSVSDVLGSTESLSSSEVVSPIIEVTFKDNKVDKVSIGKGISSITAKYDENGKILTIGVLNGWGCTISTQLKEIPIDISKATAESLESTIESELVSRQINVECTNEGITYINKYRFAGTDLVYKVGSDGDYTFEQDDSHYKDVVNKLSGMDVSNGDLELKDYELYALYNYYLESIIPNDGQPNRKVCNPEDTTNLNGPVKLKNPDGGSCDYYINWNGQWETLKNKDFWTQENLSIVKINTEGIIQWLKDHTDSINDEDAVLQTNSLQNDEEGDCYKAGLEGLSWLFCPAINNMVSVADGMDQAIDAQLSVDSSWYDSRGATREAWGYFRDIANVLMIVILLVVIVSQLTGFGIDNYGIKKILPRLIAVAVMINLSFYICQIAIDISNILGDGLSSFLKSIGLTINSRLSIGGQGIIAYLANAILALAAGAGAASSTIITLFMLKEAGPFFIATLVLTLVLVVVSIVMFFATLGARIIIIIMMTVLSPLAFACYVLPNTQKIFKKWWDIFKAALVVYPICGALYGISWIVRAVVFKPENGIHFFMAMVAMLAPFLPFLILPELLKDTLNTLGHLGNAFSRIGSSVRSGISKGMDAMQRTEAYKEASAYSSEQLQSKWDKNRIKNWGKSLNPRRQNEVNLAKQREASREAKRFKEYDDNYQTMSGAALQDELDHVEDWYRGPEDEARMAALTRNLNKMGMHYEIMSALKGTSLKFGPRTMGEFVGSGSYALSAYGKKGVNKMTGETISFDDFMNGNVKDAGSFRQYADDNNTRNIDKDTVQILNDYVEGGGSGYMSMKSSLEAVTNAADEKVRGQLNTYITNQIAERGLNASDVKDFKAASFSSLNGDTAEAMLKGETAYYQKVYSGQMRNGLVSSEQVNRASLGELRKAFESQIKGASENNQIYSNLDKSTQEVFGIDRRQVRVSNGGSGQK